MHTAKGKCITSHGWPQYFWPLTGIEAAVHCCYVLTSWQSFGLFVSCFALVQKSSTKWKHSRTIFIPNVFYTSHWNLEAGPGLSGCHCFMVPALGRLQRTNLEIHALSYDAEATSTPKSFESVTHILAYANLRHIAISRQLRDFSHSLNQTIALKWLTSLREQKSPPFPHSYFVQLVQSLDELNSLITRCLKMSQLIWQLFSNGRH